MGHSIITKNSEEFIWATVAGSGSSDKKSAFEYQVEFPCGEWSNKSWICKLKPGLILSLMDVVPLEDINYKIETKEDSIKFAFSLSGKGNYNFNFIDRQLKGGSDDELVHHSYVYFSPEIEGKGQFKANHRLQEFSIHINPAILLDYFNGQFDIGPFALRDILAGSDQVSYFHTARISTPMIAAIHQVFHCHFSGSMRQLFLESKAMELIAYKLDQIIQTKNIESKPPGLNMDDYDRIKKAVEILDNHLENPPGLFDLAKSVGTSHSRLNVCFRKVYGTTAFGYLRQIRLEKAKQLLEESGLNVTQTALSVGYNSIPSFSKAFSDYFGINPTKYIKKVF